MKYIVFGLVFFINLSLWAQQVPECIDHVHESKRKLDYLKKGIKNYTQKERVGNYNWPFKPFGTPSPLGHICHSYQNYSGQPYFHHGVDIRANALELIYSSTGGTVVNIENYVPGNHLYWEIAILDEKGFLWQYHHVDRNTIPQEIFDAYKTGNKIKAATFIGKVVYWPVKSYGTNFHHIHVNVLDGQGNYLNPLLFMIAPFDSSAPTIGDIHFVNNESNTTLAKNALKGDIDIIVKAQDLMDNQPYQMTIYKMEYEIVSQEKGKVVPKTTFWKFDTLPGGEDKYKHVYTIFKRSFRHNGRTLRTSGNYSRRDFYYVVTNQKAGKVATQESWKTAIKDTKGNPTFPNGKYSITVHATDFNGNTTSKTVAVEVRN